MKSWFSQTKHPSQLALLSDQLLSQATQTKITTHVGTCTHCQKELQDFQALKTLLQTAPEPTFLAVKLFHQRLLLQLPAREQTEVSFGWQWCVPVLVLLGLLSRQITDQLVSGLLWGQRLGWLPPLPETLGGTLETRWHALLAPWFAAAPAPLPFLLEATNQIMLWGQSLMQNWFWQVSGVFCYGVVFYLVWQGSRTKNLPIVEPTN